MRTYIAKENIRDHSVHEYVAIYPQVNPEILKRKYRARPTAEQQEQLHIRKYGQSVAADFVPGAEVLNEDEADGLDDDDDDNEDSEDDDGDEWVRTVFCFVSIEVITVARGI